MEENSASSPRAGTGVRPGGSHKRSAAAAAAAASDEEPLLDSEAAAEDEDGPPPPHPPPPLTRPRESPQPPPAEPLSSSSEEAAAAAAAGAAPEGPPPPRHRRPPPHHHHHSPGHRRRRRRGGGNRLLLLGPLMDGGGGGPGGVLYPPLGRDDEGDDDDEEGDDEEDDEALGDDEEDGPGRGGVGPLGSSESAGSGLSLSGGGGGGAPEPRKRARGSGGLASRAASTTSAASSVGGGSRGYEVVRELGPEEVRWFYREERKTWKPFIGYDSLRIELAYRAWGLLERKAAPAAQAEGVAAAGSSSPEAFEPGSPGIPPSEPVCVRGGLYEVDVANSESYPVYWNQSEKIPVMRGQWFVDGTWQPLEEEESNLIEQEHLSCFKGQQLQENFDMEVSKPLDGKEGGAQQLPLDP